MSKQQDIVIFDANVCPRFEIPGGKYLFPCEAVAAVGQIKTNLDTRNEFRNVLENLASVKSLDRSTNGTAYDSHYDEMLTPIDNHLHQIFTFIFIIEKALDPDTVALALLEDAFVIPVQQLPNITLALDQYLVTYCCDGGVCPNPMDARGVVIQTSINYFDVFLHFYLLLGQALNVTRIASLPFWEYLSKYRNCHAKIYYSSVETPPPYLGQWTRDE